VLEPPEPPLPPEPPEPPVPAAAEPDAVAELATPPPAAFALALALTPDPPAAVGTGGGVEVDVQAAVRIAAHASMLSVPTVRRGAVKKTLFITRNSCPPGEMIARFRCSM
jgi:hypothetical protein